MMRWEIRTLYPFISHSLWEQLPTELLNNVLFESYSTTTTHKDNADILLTINELQTYLLRECSTSSDLWHVEFLQPVNFLHEVIRVDVNKWGFIPVSKISEVICVDLVMIVGPPASCCSKNHLSVLSKKFPQGIDVSSADSDVPISRARKSNHMVCRMIIMLPISLKTFPIALWLTKHFYKINNCTIGPEPEHSYVHQCGRGWNSSGAWLHMQTVVHLNVRDEQHLGLYKHT